MLVVTGPGGQRVVVVVAALVLGVGAAVAQPEEVEPEPEPPAEAEEADDLSELSLEELLAVEIVTASNMRESPSRAPGVVIRLSREDLLARG